MKKILITFWALLWPLTFLFGQITLQQSDYPGSLTGMDSIAHTALTSSYPPLTAMANGVWDMTVITDTTVPYFIYRVPGVTPYPFADSNFYNLDGYFYQGNVQCELTALGLMEYGVVIPIKGFSLFVLTHVPTDSFIISEQNEDFSTPHIILAFLTESGSSWMSTYDFKVNFNMSLNVFGYNHAPGYIKTYITETDTVTGWGEMRVKDLSGVPSSYFDVLQVRKIVTTVDSFFLNGAPASTVVLTTLNFTQGQTSTTYYQDYYRKGEVTPLAEVTYPDSTYSHPVSAATHIQRLLNERVTNVVNLKDVTVYPNPVTGDFLSLEAPGMVTGRLSCALKDEQGGLTYSGNVEIMNGCATIQLPKGLTTGIYILYLTKDGEKIGVKQLEIIR